MRSCRVRALSLCAALDPSELDQLDKLASNITIGAKETLFEQDQPSDSVYNVTAGSRCASTSCFPMVAVRWWALRCRAISSACR